MKKSVKERVREILEEYADLKVSALPSLLAFNTEQTLSTITKILKDMECMNGKAQFLSKKNFNNQMGWCQGREDLRKEFWKEWEGKDK